MRELAEHVRGCGHDRQHLRVVRDLDMLDGQVVPLRNMSMMTPGPESASKVSGATNCRAERVSTAWTSASSFWSPRITSIALYAAMQPVTPRMTFTSIPYFRALRLLRQDDETDQARLHLPHCDVIDGFVDLVLILGLALSLQLLRPLRGDDDERYLEPMLSRDFSFTPPKVATMASAAWRRWTCGNDARDDGPEFLCSRRQVARSRSDPSPVTAISRVGHPSRCSMT